MTTSACNERVKSSDTSTSIATTGVGLRIDPPPAEWFLAKVTAATTSGGFNVYSLEEVEPVTTTYGYQTKSGGFTTSYAAELNNATVAVDTIVFARFRCYHSTTGETYEFKHVELPETPTVNIISTVSGAADTRPLITVPANSVADVQCVFHLDYQRTDASGGIYAEVWFQVIPGSGPPYPTSIASAWLGPIYPPNLFPIRITLVSTFQVINATGSAVAYVGEVNEGWSIVRPSGIYITQSYP